MVNIVVDREYYGPGIPVSVFRFKQYAFEINRQLENARKEEVSRKKDIVVQYLNNPKPSVLAVGNAMAACNNNAQFAKLLKTLPPAITEFVKRKRSIALDYARSRKFKSMPALSRSDSKKDSTFMFAVLTDFQKFKDGSVKQVQLAQYRTMIEKIRNCQRNTYSYALCICLQPKFKWLAFRLRKVFLIHYTGKDSRMYPLSLFAEKTNPYTEKVPKVSESVAQKSPHSMLAEYQEGYQQDFIDARGPFQR